MLSSLQVYSVERLSLRRAICDSVTKVFVKYCCQNAGGDGLRDEGFGVVCFCNNLVTGLLIDEQLVTHEAIHDRTCHDRFNFLLSI